MIYRPPAQPNVYNPSGTAYGGYGYGGYYGNTAGSFAVVVEKRHLDLKKGENKIRFSNVPALIEPSTVQFKSLTDPNGTAIVQQSFAYDLANPDTLLARFVDRQITVVTDAGEVAGTLLSYDARQLVLKTADKKQPLRIIQRGDHVRDIRFGSIDDLVTVPTLEWTVRAKKAGRHLTQVTYRTKGLAWRADYTAVFDDVKGTVDLTGWVSIYNNSGTDFDDAQIVLVAGQLDVSQNAQPYGGAYGYQQPPKVSETFVYPISRKTKLVDGETVQLELFDPMSGARAKQIWLYDALASSNTYSNPGYPQSDCYMYQYQGSRSHTERHIEIAVGKGKRSFPEGRARLFKRGKSGVLELVGEDQLKPSAASGKVRLKIGSSELIKGERKQVDCRPETQNRQLTEKIEVTVTNKTKRVAEVVVRESMQRWSNWEIESESIKGTRDGTAAREYRLKIPAGGSKSVTYTVRYSW